MSNSDTGGVPQGFINTLTIVATVGLSLSTIFSLVVAVVFRIRSNNHVTRHNKQSNSYSHQIKRPCLHHCASYTLAIWGIGQLSILLYTNAWRFSYSVHLYILICTVCLAAITVPSLLGYLGSLLYFSFRESAFAINKKIKFAIILLILMDSLSWMCFAIYFIKYHSVSDIDIFTNSKKRNTLLFVSNTLMVISCVLTINIVLFASLVRLYKVQLLVKGAVTPRPSSINDIDNNNNNGNNGNQINDTRSMVFLATKYAILNILASIYALIYMILILVTMFENDDRWFFIMFAIFVSSTFMPSIAIFLSFAFTNDYYLCLCSTFHNKCHNLCVKIIQRIETKEKLRLKSMETNSNSNSNSNSIQMISSGGNANLSSSPSDHDKQDIDIDVDFNYQQMEIQSQ